MSTLHEQIHEYYNFILPLVLQAGKVSVSPIIIFTKTSNNNNLHKK